MGGLHLLDLIVDSGDCPVDCRSKDGAIDFAQGRQGCWSG